MGLDVYTTTAEPTDLMNTGGDRMSMIRNGLASELILEENDGGSPGDVSPTTASLRLTKSSGFPRCGYYIKMPVPTMASTTLTCT